MMNKDREFKLNMCKSNKNMIYENIKNSSIKALRKNKVTIKDVIKEADRALKHLMKPVSSVDGCVSLWKLPLESF